MHLKVYLDMLLVAYSLVDRKSNKIQSKLVKTIKKTV